ncbi:MAG TPA: GMC oxidoreductase, partial [Solirubrobacteraceae bacterium]|nr:GMC oxidoreductase [Solirubrobacteraceae bacterium]
SGRWRPDARAQALADAVLADDRVHSPSSITTRRQVGGTSVIWGGRCVPFDPVDFDRRESIGAAWPIGYEDVVPHFQRACDWLVCGRAVFDADEVPTLRGRPLVPGFPDGAVRNSALERWSLPTDFAREYGRRLRASATVRVVSPVTCTEIVTEQDRPAVRHLAARALDGRRLTVRARRYVLACGGLEATRLLLASRAPAGHAVGDHSGHLGRWYMAHVEGGVARARFTTPPRQTRYGYERDVDGVYVRRRLSFAREHLREHGLPNVVAWLANPELPDPAHGNGPLSFAYLALSSPLGRWFAPEAQRWSLTGRHVPGAPYGVARRGRVSEHVRNVARQPLATLRFVGGFGRNRFLARRRAPGFFVYSPDNAYPLQYHGEHLPHRDSRVTLADERDALGMPRLRIDLRFSDADVEGVVRAHEQWDAYLRAHGIGRLEYRSDDVAGEVWRRIGGGFHQAGTTRMAACPDDGVVDADLAVHGHADLFVVSSSTFVTSSQANSTFMVVALAVRLADHLKRLRGR